MARPLNEPSTRGFPRSPSITPSNSPTPPSGTDEVGAATIVMMPARKRWLSCQSALETWNGSRDALPQPVVPSKATNVSAVAKRLGANSMASPVNV